MIALLCPTRGRPDSAMRMEDSALATARNAENIRTRYAIHESERALYTSGAENLWKNVSFYNGEPTTVFLWNSLAMTMMKRTEIRLFMLAGDDMIFTTPGWDAALLEHHAALENKIHVYALRDSRDENGTPHPIVTREYFEAMGYFMPPIFLHWYIDTWTVEIATANGCFTHMRDYMLVHDKPSDKGQADETHNRIRRMGWHERDKYVNDTCQHFLEFEKQRLAEAITK